MTVIQINKWIGIKPNMLGPNFQSNVKKQLESVLTETCTKDHGYILKVLEMQKINDNYISNSNSDIMVSINCSVESFNPSDIVDNLKSKVCAIYDNGTLVEVHGIQKVLLPVSTYSSQYVHDKFKDALVDKNNNKEIHVGDEIDIKITATKYEDHKFSCLGVII